MGRGAQTESSVVPARRGGEDCASGALVRPAEILAHQEMSEAEAGVIREAESSGILGWEVDGHGRCRELYRGSATEISLPSLPLPVALEAWCSERLDFDHLMGALARATTRLPDSAYVAFPDLLELP